MKRNILWDRWLIHFVKLFCIGFILITSDMVLLSYFAIIPLLLLEALYSMGCDIEAKEVGISECRHQTFEKAHHPTSEARLSSDDSLKKQAA